MAYRSSRGRTTQCAQGGRRREAKAHDRTSTEAHTHRSRKAGEQGEATEEKESVVNDKTPRNEKGQPPTMGGRDTIERLEEKKKEDTGRANKERIEDQEREVGTGR